MRKILIVEDTLAIREEIFDILSMENYEVFQAENGLTGFEMALKEQPDLIISDILMPDLDGYEMFEKLQINKNTASIPLIFLSAKSEKEDVRTGMNLGAEDYLTKPLNINDLLNAVKSKIKKKLIIEQNIINKATATSTILKKKKNELDNYAHLISNELKSSLRNISGIITDPQEVIDKTISFKDSTIEIQLKGENKERNNHSVQYNTKMTFKRSFNFILVFIISIINLFRRKKISKNIEKPSYIFNDLILKTPWSIKLLNNNLSKIETNISKQYGKKELIKVFRLFEEKIFKDNVFKDHEISIKEFSRVSEVPLTHCFYLLKFHVNIDSFTKFKNFSRIAVSLKLIENNYLDNDSIESLTLAVGFQTYNSFYNSFKTYTSLTPKEYLLSR
ncbi:MAG: DNA-binding response OmpR family regulator/AraC-like DNA-binding protein [Urechidicola sp.]|jgi:DNA-binding response OmpR family regulator/AraC-like DNA-binding protein